jgi:hypothetical protein
MAPLLRERLSIPNGDPIEFLAVEPDRDVLDWFGDFSYHFLGFWGKRQDGSGEMPRPLISPELLWREWPYRPREVFGIGCS